MIGPRIGMRGGAIAGLRVGPGVDPIYAGSYPRTAAELARVLGGLGTWSGGAGYLFDEASGNLSSVYGTPATLTAANSPSYRNPGPLGGGDGAIGIDTTGVDLFDGGNNFGLTAAQDLIGIGTIKLPLSTSSFSPLVSKGSGADPDFWILYTASNALTMRVLSGGVLRYDVSSASTASLLNRWCAFSFAIDQGGGKVRVGLRDLLSGTTAIGALTAESAFVAGAANTFRIGSQAGHGAVATSSQYSCLYIASGAGVNNGLAANMPAALAAFSVNIMG